MFALCLTCKPEYHFPTEIKPKLFSIEPWSCPRLLYVQALGVTQTQENAARELEEDMETAVAKEDYSAAAKARAELDSMYAMDTVAGLVNVSPPLPNTPHPHPIHSSTALALL